MNDTLGLVVTGLTIGLAYAAVPGAVNTESMRRTLSLGPRDGFSVQAGSLVGDLLWAVIGLTGAAVLLRNESIAIALGLIGGGFLLMLARSALTTALHGPKDDHTGHSGSSLKVGITFGLANPAGIVFWSGLGAGTLNQSGHTSSGQMIALISSFGLGALAWGLLIVAIVSFGRRFASGRILRWVDAVCAVVLGWFGVRLIWTTFQRARTWLTPTLRAVF